MNDAKHQWNAVQNVRCILCVSRSWASSDMLDIESDSCRPLTRLSIRPFLLFTRHRFSSTANIRFQSLLMNTESHICVTREIFLGGSNFNSNMKINTRTPSTAENHIIISESETPIESERVIHIPVCGLANFIMFENFIERNVCIVWEGYWLLYNNNTKCQYFVICGRSVYASALRFERTHTGYEAV